jgi:hypothetical protein
LVERLLREQEAAGSNPVTPIGLKRMNPPMNRWVYAVYRSAVERAATHIPCSRIV